MNTVVFDRVSLPRSHEVESAEGAADRREAQAVVCERPTAGAPTRPAAVDAGVDASSSRAAVLRTALVVGSIATAVVTSFAAAGSAHVVEPELAVLLRGMAAIKGLLAVAAASLAWWRLGLPVRVQAAAAYIACVWVLFAGTALIWQLAFIVAAAIVFHAALFFGLILALREGRGMSLFRRQAPDPSIQRTGQ